MPDSLEALRAANPRSQAAFATALDAATETIRARVGATPPRTRRRPLIGATLAAAAVAAAAVLWLAGSPGGPAVENASAALRRAATVTAALAQRSGTATVRITRDGALWAGTTVRWNGDDLELGREARRDRPGASMLVVDDKLYGLDEDGKWLEMGTPDNIDPGSGTTPAEYLAAVREDVGGATLSRLTTGASGLAREQRPDGSAVYRGTVAAGLIARETGFKEGEAIRVLPFGYVAHGAAADPGARLDIAIAVAADGVVREIAVSWDTWRYVVGYRDLGSTPAPQAPAGAPSLLEQRKRR